MGMGWGPPKQAKATPHGCAYSAALAPARRLSTIAQAAELPVESRRTRPTGITISRNGNAPVVNRVIMARPECSPREKAFSLGEHSGRAMITRLTTGAFPFREMVMPVGLVLRDSTGSSAA